VQLHVLAKTVGPTSGWSLKRCKRATFEFSHLTYRYYSMEHSPWEANRFAASQEISRVLWNPKFHYRIHKCLPPVSILSQSNQSIPHIPLPEDPPLPHMPGSTKWSLSLRFSHQNPVYTCSLPHTCYMSCPSHFRFYHPHSSGWGVQIIKLMKFSLLLCYLIL
jgi:hypothetical protein